MKNLLCVAILCIGFFSISQAQVLEYYVANGTTNQKWDWAISDAGPTPAIYELNMAPGEQRQGFIGFFAFPVEWKAVNNNGCYVSNLDLGPVLATTLPTTCASVTVIYKIVEIVPFVYYIYKAELG